MHREEMACKPVETAVVLLLLLVATALKEANTQVICTHQYGREPFIDATFLDCDPTGALVRIGCGVNGPNAEIRWHRSRTANTAGRVNASAIQSNRSTRFTISEQTNGLTISFLQIRNFRLSDFRYYWCSVAVDNRILPNPSEVIMIARPCDPDAPQCRDPVRLDQATTGERCATDENNAVIPAAPDCPTPASQQPSPSMLPSPSISFSLPAPSDTFSASTATSVTSPSLAILPSVGSTETDFMPSPTPTNIISGGERAEDSVNWPLYVGIAAAIILAATAIVLVLIVCVQCKLKRLKASTYSVNPIAALSAAEERSSVAQNSEHNAAAIELEPQKDHDYSEIAAFLGSGAEGSAQGAKYETIQDSSNSKREGSGHTHVVITYEDVLPDPAQMGRRHPYDVVEDASPDYHRLQHENSLRSQGSRPGSFKLRASVQLSNSSNGSSLASADALQATRPHIDIYQSELDISSDDEYSHLGRSESTLEGSAAQQQQQRSVLQPRGIDPALSLSESLLPLVNTMYNKTPLSRSATLPIASTSTLREDEENQTEVKQPLVEEFESLIEASDTADAAPPVQPAQGEDETDTYSRLVETGKGARTSAEVNQAEVLQEALYSAVSESPQAQVETGGNDHEYHELEGPQIVSKATPGSAPPAEQGTAPDGTNSQKSKRQGEYNHLEPKKALGKSKSFTLGTSGTVFTILAETSNPELGIDGVNGDLQLPATDSKHTYTPLIKESIHTYTMPILSTPEKYVSEHGHVYHTLGNSEEN